MVYFIEKFKTDSIVGASMIAAINLLDLGEIKRNEIGNYIVHEQLVWYLYTDEYLYIGGMKQINAVYEHLKDTLMI